MLVRVTINSGLISVNNVRTKKEKVYFLVALKILGHVSFTGLNLLVMFPVTICSIYIPMYFRQLVKIF